MAEFKKLHFLLHLPTNYQNFWCFYTITSKIKLLRTHTAFAALLVVSVIVRGVEGAAYNINLVALQGQNTLTLQILAATALGQGVHLQAQRVVIFACCRVRAVTATKGEVKRELLAPVRAQCAQQGALMFVVQPYLKTERLLM